MPDAPVLAPLEVAVPAAEGLILKGMLSHPSGPGGTSSPLAVLAYQYPATRDSYAPLLADLLDLGNAAARGQRLGHVTTRVAGGSAHAMAIYFDVRDELLGSVRQALGR